MPCLFGLVVEASIVLLLAKASGVASISWDGLGRPATGWVKVLAIPDIVQLTANLTSC